MSTTTPSVEIGFSLRLAYVRWLRDRGRIVRESDRQFAERMNIGEKWVTKWKLRDDAPEGRSEYDALRCALAPMGVAMNWLYDGTGAAPEPRLWVEWTAHIAPDPSRDVEVSPARVSSVRASTNRKRNTRQAG